VECDEGGLSNVTVPWQTKLSMWLCSTDKIVMTITF